MFLLFIPRASRSDESRLPRRAPGREEGGEGRAPRPKVVLDQWSRRCYQYDTVAPGVCIVCRIRHTRRTAIDCWWSAKKVVVLRQMRRRARRTAANAVRDIGGRRRRVATDRNASVPADMHARRRYRHNWSKSNGHGASAQVLASTRLRTTLYCRCGHTVTVHSAAPTAATRGATAARECAWRLAERSQCGWRCDALLKAGATR